MFSITAAVLAATLAVTPSGGSGGPSDAAVVGPAVEAPPKVAWPQELANRGTVLTRGTIEVVVPLGINLTSDRTGQPIFLNPALMIGVTDDLSIGISHYLGVCFNTVADGCPQPYNDVALAATWRVVRAGGAEVALGLAFDTAPIDPFTASTTVKVQARWAGGPFAFALAPALSIGLSQRDLATSGKRMPIAFPLGTYTFGWYQDTIGNRDVLSVPAVVQVQVIPQLAAAAGLAMLAPLDPIAGGPSDYATFPFGVAVIVTPTGLIDVGVSLTFRSLFGRENWPESRPGESRLGQLFVAARF